jgi:NAD(P)-dependent dehydrogenase (short-subunit alcohol dehydrogenase family)
MLYLVAKAGVLAMTRSLAVEWAKYGIRTNAIARTFPTKGAWDRLMPGDLAEKFDMAKGSTTTCWRSSGISQFGSIWFLISQLISMVKL